MTTASANIDAMRLAALSQRLGIPARQLLIAAARLAESPGRMSDPAFRARVLADARSQSAAAEASARVLLAPLATFAVDEIDRLFAGIWPPAESGGD